MQGHEAGRDFGPGADMFGDRLNAQCERKGRGHMTPGILLFSGNGSIVET